MREESYIALELDPQVRERLSLPEIPFPVRRDRLREIVHPGGLHVDMLLEELAHVISVRPDAASVYGPIIARLTLVLALKAGSEGLPNYAASLLELGLLHAPGDLGLLANRAFGLHMGGQLEEAVAEYRTVIDALPLDASPLLRILAARACGQMGDYTQGHRLLTEGTEGLAGDEGFIRLVETYREKAGVAAPRGPVAHEPSPRRQPVAEDAPHRPKFCRSCGTALRPRVRFCPACGGTVEVR